MFCQVPFEITGMYCFKITLVTEMRKLVLVHRIDVLFQVPFPERREVALRALCFFPFPMLLFDVCCHRGSPPSVYLLIVVAKRDQKISI